MTEDEGENQVGRGEPNRAISRRKLMALLGSVSLVALSTAGSSDGFGSRPEPNATTPTGGTTEPSPPTAEGQVAATPTAERQAAANIKEYGGVKDDDSAEAMVENVRAIDEASRAADNNMVFLPAGVWYIGVPNRSDGTLLNAGSNSGGRGDSSMGFLGVGPEYTTLKIGHAPQGGSNRILYSAESSHPNVAWRNLTYDGNYHSLDFRNRDTTQWGIRVFGDGEFRFENVRFQNHHGNGIAVHGDSDANLRIDRCSFHDIGVGRTNQTDGNKVGQPLSISGDTDLTVTNSEFTLTTANPIDYGNGATGECVVRNCYGESLGVGFIKINDATSITLERINATMQTQALLDAQDDSNDTEFAGRWFLRRQDGDTTDPVPVTLNDIRATDTTRGAIRVANGYDVELRGGRKGPITFRKIARSGRFARAFEDTDSVIAFDLGEMSVHDVGGVVFGLSTSTGSVGALRRDNTEGLGSTGGVSIGEDAVGSDPFVPDVPAQTEVGVHFVEDAVGADPFAPHVPAQTEVGVNSAGPP